ncbi:hypothetical protein Bbelb_027530 [Branchiostoma belcheri]|nr:hypothetical protein Bbelb_027530 [Branchiostoma belcheri]
MRVMDDPYDPTTIVNYKDGNPITCEHRIKDRWQEYFNELLNPSDQENTHHKFQPVFPDVKEPTILKSEMGFRKGRGCTDAIFALRQLSEKAIEYNKELNLVFVDQEKAFDRVNREKLWTVLEHPYAERTHKLVLSPLLFIIYMDKITKQANPKPEALNELLFADDQNLISEKTDRLQEHTTTLNTACEDYDMRISINKTESLKISRTPGNLDIDRGLKQVKEFKYHGSIFTEDGKLDREIETRVRKANSISYQLAPLLKHPSIPMETKAKLFNSIFLPTLTYQCQTWTLTKPLERKIITCEMRCLRRLVNRTRRDKIRNTTIRQMAGVRPV